MQLSFREPSRSSAKNPYSMPDLISTSSFAPWISQYFVTNKAKFAPDNRSPFAPLCNSYTHREDPTN